MEQVGMSKGLLVRVRGTVQGVGFRPAVWKLAHDCDLVGDVCNDAEGVLIRIQGTFGAVQHFIHRLQSEAPPLASIESVETTDLAVPLASSDFSIVASRHGRNDIRISADAATCSDCRAEISDPRQRRYLYPFTNCTHCGPRLSIVTGVPYDRSATTMQHFPMCDTCREEYQNPADRRFHAQPIACHQCGPQIWLEDNVGENLQAGDSAETLQLAASLLKMGKILAVRGLGGFHLAVDANNEQAVRRLRNRKHRYSKPLALMTDKIEKIERYCRLHALEKAQLLSPQAPIVLLETRLDADALRVSPSVAPGSPVLGFMLAYSPLHILLCQHFSGPLVMTSGNFSEQPQVVGLETARSGLSQIADVLLMHDRDIANRVDDSVVRLIGGQIRLLRRARGYAPQAIALPRGFESASDILAYGGELKSTFCLVKEGAAILSQHQGDLEDPATFDDFEHNLALYLSQYEQHPEQLACDLHPEYLSAKLAAETAARHRLSLTRIQHHHAHVASCLADNQWPLQPADSSEKVLGIALDGLGYGADDTLWGAEFLLADYRSSQRLASFDAIAMPGGAMAIKEPWRNTFASIVEYLGWEHFCQRYSGLELCRYLRAKPVELLQKMLGSGIGAPRASSCGRLFDAVAAALGLARERAYYEGEGAIALEMLVDRQAFEQRLQQHRPDAQPAYAFALTQEGALRRISAGPMWLALLEDLHQQIALPEIALRFHLGLARAIADMVEQLSLNYSFRQVVLCGGCAQNRLLAQAVQYLLQAAGFPLLMQSRVPANDGGLSLGQAAITAARQIDSRQNSAVG